MSTARRVGVFGGSFDPVHLGHLLVAHAAREELRLDGMIFVPTRCSPFKPDRPPTGGGVRLRMLRLALAGLEWCAVSDLELRRPGVSYTIDTVQQLREECGPDLLFLLIGEDHLQTLPQWRAFEQLRELVQFVVVPRPGFSPAPAPTGVTSHRLTGWPAQISSSAIRERIREGRSVDPFVPPAVAEVIRHNGLYLP